MSEFFYSIADFFSRNEGQIIGSSLGAFFAALVAFYSARKTHLFAKQREKKKLEREEEQKINQYCSLLHSVIVELNWHTEINPMIISQVEGIREKSKNAGRMIIDEPTTFIKTDYLRKLRDQFYDFDFSNLVIATHLQLYINRAEIINRSLELSIIDETAKRFDEPEKFRKAVDLYFDQLMKDFGQLEVALKLNLNFSLQEINQYPDASAHQYYDHSIESEKNINTN
ncbi:hypothetical protein NC796_25770 [Aliifodinibius sp. S!AR15-10]|uniref:hypothetical protein n=1 Tax=Aliifodinibius sp. S!AR15-10 TaxID=2950437 RepID=UPI00285F49E0|nr:hypothetical protein [Aliifodinibius sp. S!AR15-10]MDR8394580.1 hypothetical protein [Aliifodinibius sp. S!AR15-10]